MVAGHLDLASGELRATFTAAAVLAVVAATEDLFVALEMR
jgi:hypothetical protein